MIPAAGRGSRLSSTGPKALHEVAGRPMLDWLIDLYKPHAEAVVLVLQPESVELVARHTKGWLLPTRIALQEQPTGMVDALLAARPAAAQLRPERVWVTWCDQIAVRRETVRALSAADEEREEDALILPTVQRVDPYVHLETAREGGVSRVRHRREGDRMPGIGRSDVGLFSMSAATFDEDLPRYAEGAEPGALTGELNFLPFLTWLSQRGAGVATIPASDPEEAVGVNDAADQARVEAFLKDR